MTAPHAAPVSLASVTPDALKNARADVAYWLDRSEANRLAQERDDLAIALGHLDRAEDWVCVVKRQMAGRGGL